MKYIHVTALGVLCCFALFVCLILLASFISHLKSCTCKYSEMPNDQVHVWPAKGYKYTSPAQSVEHGDVGKHVEDVVGVRWVVGRGPLLRCG